MSDILKQAEEIIADKHRADLRQELAQFTGSEVIYKHSFGRIVYTEGVKYLAEQAKAYWLIDLVASYQVHKNVKNEPFQVYELTVDTEKNTGFVKITDGNDHELARQEIPLTDFPLENIVIWCVDGVVMLPSEY